MPKDSKRSAATSPAADRASSKRNGKSRPRSKAVNRRGRARTPRQKIHSVSWSSSGSPLEVKQAATQAAAILSGEPATASDLPGTLAAGHSKGELAQRAEPISYREVGPLYASPLATFDPVIGRPRQGASS